MAQNPLLGKKISLISKKNIRYEGVLYSVNEQNATVALKNVKSFGTEERGDQDQAVAASEAVHPFLLFRGQDIKDLHVHEEQAEAKPPPNAPAPKAAPPKNEPPPQKAPQKQQQQQQSTQPSPQNQSGRGGGNRRQRKNNNNAAVGTGASLLNRKARGAVANNENNETSTDFDFESQNDQFEKPDQVQDDDRKIGTYAKDDFFDSISCDALDKQQGVDNRLKSHTERKLNVDTFGAVALNSNRRRGRYGRGRGRGGGRGGRGRSNNNRRQQQHRQQQQQQQS